jgi:hypothetical protein
MPLEVSPPGHLLLIEYTTKTDIKYMKKLVSTQGLLYGQFEDKNTSSAINERVNPKLETCYNKNSRNGDIHIESKLSYSLFDGQVTTLLLIYTIDNPTTQRLEDFRDMCVNFYEIFGFMIDNDSSAPCVFLKATDIYDMASLIHALDYHTVSLESVMCAIDADLTEKDAIYSPTGTHLMQLPDVPRYRIKEGTLFICPGATRHCKCLRELDVPKSLLNHEEALSDYPYPLRVKVWETHYDGTTVDDEEDTEDEFYKEDEYGVFYSQDGKILKSCQFSFNETHYEVPDGVEEIDFGAFCTCRHFLELSIPRSVKIIGDSIFGNGGVIMIRDE